MTQNSKVISIKRGRGSYLGIIIFGVIFIYIIICVVIFFRTEHIVRYEVKEGALTTNSIYQGIILRDETVVNSNTAGYVNLYAREGERIANGGLMFVVDETGRLSQQIEEMNLGENSLSDKELKEFRNDIINYCHSFSANQYKGVYDFKFSLKNSLLKLANQNMLESLDVFKSGEGSLKMQYAPDNGIVVYWTDGLENLTPQNISEQILKGEDYHKTAILGNDLIEEDMPVCKILTNEKWSVVIEVDPSDVTKLLNEGYIKVRFLKNQLESWGEVKPVNSADGKTYLQLDFTNSMITFSNDRFLELELLLEDERGLKIPVSSIAQKEFFLIPERFVTRDGGKNGKGSIIRQRFDENGNLSSEVLEVEVYNFDKKVTNDNKDEKYYYVDNSILNIGDVLLKMEGMETFTVSERATMTGVYNMNKGYTDFRRIIILSQNDEYAIVESGTSYGLNVYDYIVLNAEAVSDNQFINAKQ